MAESCQRACYEKYILEQRAKHISKVIKNTNLVWFVKEKLQTNARMKSGSETYLVSQLTLHLLYALLGVILRLQNENTSVWISVVLLHWKSTRDLMSWKLLTARIRQQRNKLQTKTPVLGLHTPSRTLLSEVRKASCLVSVCTGIAQRPGVFSLVCLLN